MFRRVMGGPPFLGSVRDQVERRLQRFVDAKRTEASEIAPEATELVQAVEGLTMRGGKRLRPQVVAAAYLASRPDGDLAATIEVGAALELLQSFLLIHDDWMDRDDERRGGPSVHALLRERHGDAHLGASLAILAGDLASVYAAELFAQAPFADRRRAEAIDAYHRMQREVFFGQQLDLIASPRVERMYDLKTGSYTVRGPFRLGALLADAPAEHLAALDRLAAPLGVAFQLRDELLGTFGDPAVTGKPAGGDLRSGKHTSLVEEARATGSEAQKDAIARVHGRADAKPGDVARAAEALVASGARERVEGRLREHIGAAEEELERLPLDTAPLRAVADLLAFRDR